MTVTGETSPGVTGESTGDDESGTTTGAGTCGDGIVELGEECDDGPGNDNYAACTAECQLNECGDGNVHAGVEACDEGAGNVDSGYCRPDCTLNVCGDGFVFAEIEECDSGLDNGSFYGECDDACTLNRCGDGELDAGHEQCDAGDQNGSVDSGEAGMAGCGVDCGFAGRRIFVSSKLFSGDMGSRAGADLACQNMAKVAKLPQPDIFRAFLADSQGSPNTFVDGIASKLPFIAPTGLILAADYDALIELGPGAGVTITETAEVLSGKPVWTNVGPFGDPFLLDPEHTCADWTSDDDSMSARVGLNAVGPDDYSQWQDEHQWLTYAAKPCNGLYRIYCVQVPVPE